jgi:hypothetical protein
MRPEVKEILKKRDELIDLQQQIKVAIEEAQARSIKALPRLEEYGWSRLDVFAKRLRDALDDPFVEQARRILEKAGLQVDLQTVKDFVRQRGQNTLDVVKQIVSHLSEIKEEEISWKVVKDVENRLKQGEWDEAVSRTQEWTEFCHAYRQMAQEPESAIRTLALNELLEQGPGSSVPERFNTIKEQAIALGGPKLWKVLSKESARTLNDVKASLDKLSESKTDLEQIKGEWLSLISVLEGRGTVDDIHEHLLQKIQECRRQLSEKRTEVEILLRKVNNLALLAGEDQEELKQLNSLKEAQANITYLQKRLAQLRERIRDSLSEDAASLADALAQRQLPDGWDNGRTVVALRQLLERCSLRLEV